GGGGSIGASGNARMWFLPNEMALKRHVDPDTGQATIVFDQATVELRTQSLLFGLPEDPIFRDFANHFTANYDAFAALAFPVLDKDGVTIIQAPIFEQLREVMQAISLARFFRDNDIPLDMWWLNSFNPEEVVVPRSTPTAVTDDGTFLIHGGVTVTKPNDYTPSSDADMVGDMVISDRPAAPAGTDLQDQAWDVPATPDGNFTAVSASLKASAQESTQRIVETDLSFPSPGGLALAFTRYYDSAFIGSRLMGAGWRIIPFTLELGRPSWFDENGLMRDAMGNPVDTDNNSDTRLRSGEVRFVNHATGEILNFFSSLDLAYGTDSLDNAVVVITGLNANNRPDFTPGPFANGAVLTQDTDSDFGYTLDFTDGSQMTFDHDGHLETVTNQNGFTLTYANDSACKLMSISDSAGQSLTISYDAEDRVQSVVGPFSEQVTYTYDVAGCLDTATHMRSGASTDYDYNAEDQLTGVTPFDGITSFTSTPDLRGRSDDMTDQRGNLFDHHFDLDPVTLNRTTEIVDMGSASQATFMEVTDVTGRLLMTEDPEGNHFELGYFGDSRFPNEITLPTPGRAAIRVDRNEAGQPTRVIDPERMAIGAQEAEITYNAANLPTSVTDAAGRVTEFEYDPANNLTMTRQFLGGTPVETVFTYENGALKSVIDPNGNTVRTISRDGLGRIESVVEADGVTVDFAYDTLGRLETITDPRFSLPLTYSYNDFDQVTSLETPSGTITYTYDPATQRLTSIVDPNSNELQFNYDPLTGDLVSTTEVMAAGPDVTVGFNPDRFGRLDRLDMPEGQDIQFQYDDLGRLISIEDGEFQTVTVTQPDGRDDVAVGEFEIRWVDEDTDDNATISLFFDTDNTGEDGTLITGGIQEDDEGEVGDAFLWDTSSVPDGDYYVYAVIDDGVNPPAVAYSVGLVTVVGCVVDGDCDNGIFCDGAETCVAGSCQAAAAAVDCDDGVSCTVDACNEATASCDNTTDDGACDNGLFCDGTETCDETLGCQAGTAVDCDDGVSCTVDACNEATDACDNITDDCDNGLFDLTVTANPPSVDEPGGVASFMIHIDNTGNTAVDVTALSDDLLGDLDGQGTCTVPQTIAVGTFYQCSFSAAVNGNAGTSITDTVAASGSGSAGSVNASDGATVTINDVAPSITLAKSADPTSVEEPGGAVSFSVRVDNTSPAEAATLTGLVDDVHGDLDGQGDCAVPQTIPVSGFYACSFTVTLSGAAGDSETDTVTATAQDDETNTTTAIDSATVTITGVDYGDA
ncbi:MAG: RHS repeat protein, partial [Actinomycetia bacterium]|nr:RHS repeat protein [Actinomycetes bacterium]